MLHVSTLPPKWRVYPSLYPSPWTPDPGVRMRRAVRFRHTLFFCNVVVSVAGVPCFSMRMLVNFGEFLIDFGTISGPFFTFKPCLNSVCSRCMSHTRKVWFRTTLSRFWRFFTFVVALKFSKNLSYFTHFFFMLSVISFFEWLGDHFVPPFFLIFDQI